jgi:hypothetical protein
VFFSARDDGLLVYTLLGGFDASQKPTLAVMPALGARAGIEWLGDHTTAGLSVTGVSDLVRRTDPLGNQAGGLTFSVAATIGWVAAER